MPDSDLLGQPEPHFALDQRPIREPTLTALFYLPMLGHRGGQCGKPEPFRPENSWEFGGEPILETTVAQSVSPLAQKSAS